MRRLPILVAWALAAVAVPACERGDAPVTPQRSDSSPAADRLASPSAPVAATGYSDPDRVCRGLVAAMLGSDTTTDDSPLDAYRRASAFLAEPVAVAEPGRADARWREWAVHRARVEVEFAEWAGELPPDEDGLAWRAVTATATPVGADGWRGTAQRQTVYCALTGAGQRWLVASFDVDNLGPA